MKMVWSRYGLELQLCENQISTIVMETPLVFTQFLQTIIRQIEGEEGDLLLSEGDKIFTFSKNVVLIDNPLMINCNEKRIISKIHKELGNIVNTEMYEKYSMLNTEIVKFVETAMDTVPYHLEMDYQVDVTELFKTYDVKIATEETDPLEKLIDYPRALHTICNVKCFIVLNLKHFFTEEQVKQVYEICFYEKIFLINMEGVKTYLTDVEKCVIIDKDLCLIQSEDD